MRTSMASECWFVAVDAERRIRSCSHWLHHSLDLWWPGPSHNFHEVGRALLDASQDGRGRDFSAHAHL